MLDFDKIHLTNEELKVFMQFKKKKKILLNEDNETKFADLGLITWDKAEPVDYDDLFNSKYEDEARLTTAGERYLSYISKKRMNKIAVELRAWGALALSIAAFIVSIIALSR